MIEIWNDAELITVVIRWILLSFVLLFFAWIAHARFTEERSSMTISLIFAFLFITLVVLALRSDSLDKRNKSYSEIHNCTWSEVQKLVSYQTSFWGQQYLFQIGGRLIKTGRAYNIGQTVCVGKGGYIY